MHACHNHGIISSKKIMETDNHLKRNDSAIASSVVHHRCDYTVDAAALSGITLRDIANNITGMSQGRFVSAETRFSFFLEICSTFNLRYREGTRRFSAAGRNFSLSSLRMPFVDIIFAKALICIKGPARAGEGVGREVASSFKLILFS